MPKRGNIDNLIKNEDLTPEQRRENARKAGLASAEAKKKRKTLREELIALLETEQYQSKISLSLIKQAEDGNTKAFEVIRDTIGEKPNEKLELEQNKPFEVNINIKKRNSMDIEITEKQEQFINSEAFETLFGGAARWSENLMVNW